MPRLVGVVSCVAILFAMGCEDELQPIDAAVPVDLRRSDDLLPPPDAGTDGLTVLDAADPAPVHGVRCGDEVCFAEAMQYCHTTDWGESGICATRPAPAPGFFSCDGPEDCASGACCFLDNASVCGLFGFCVSGMTVGEFMCHDDVECGPASRCCKKGMTGSYRACVDGLGATDPCPAPN